MRFLSIFALSWIAVICGCTRPTSDASKTSTAPALLNASTGLQKVEQLGVERVFTNTQVVMWMPSRAEYLDGDYHGSDFTSVTFGAIDIMIRIKDSGQDPEQSSELASDWAFQDHPSLSTRDSSTREGQPRKQMCKTIWDATRKRKLFIYATVLSTDIYAYDMETATKMIESIRIIKPPRDDK
jgi:hypothetical protein